MSIAERRAILGIPKRTRTSNIMPKRTMEPRRPAKRFKTSKALPSRPARRALSRTLGVEVKYFDVAVGFTIPSTVDWTTTQIGADMPQIAQGDDIVNRNGRKIQLQRVMFRGTVMTAPTTAQSAVTGPNSVRIVLVHNKQPNATNLTGDLVMGLNGGAAANTSVAIHMFQGVQGFGRFKIVDDILLNLDVNAAVNNASATTVSAASVERSFTLQYRPKKPIVIEYAGSATAVPNTNSFNILANAEATQYTPNLQGVIRFYFTDV